MFGEMRLAILNRLTTANGTFTHYCNSKYYRVLDVVLYVSGQGIIFNVIYFYSMHRLNQTH